MTDRERLIELIRKGYETVPVGGFVYEGIADYLLENGVIVQPCKLGEKMYCDGKYFASHCTGEIMEFTVNRIETTVSNIFRGEIDVKFDFEDFGKTVFLTREEAEQALKGRENNV